MSNNREVLAQEIVKRFIASISGTYKNTIVGRNPNECIYVGKLSPQSSSDSISSSVLIKQISIDFRIPASDIENASLDITPQGNFFYRIVPTYEQQKEAFFRDYSATFTESEVVDFEDMSESLSIMDLGLNDFRIDLLTYIKTHPNPEKLPYGINAVVKGEKPGVIFVLRNRNEGINIKHRNRLHPFYMIYIGDDGEVIENYLAPKRILDEMRALAKGKTAPDFELCHRFNDETNDGRKMDKYSELLKQAVISMIQVKEESDVDSFFGDDETSFLNDTIKGLDEFELICFMVVKND